MSKTKSFDFWSDFDKNDKSHSKMRKDFLVNTVKSWTLSKKISYSKRKIREFIKFCEDNNLEIPSVSFSGGKDSTVLLHLVSQFINNPKCIVAAELFHPENVKIINSLKNKEIYKPLITFDQIIKTVGFPMVSKEISQKIRAVRDAAILGKWTKACFGLRKSRKISKIYLHLLDKSFVKYELTNKCCDYIKGNVKKNKLPKFVGTTVYESQLRRTNWINKGCNVYTDDVPYSRPISLWTEEDIYKYIKKNNIKISEAYNMGWRRTGCTLCGFGLRLECRECKRAEKNGNHNLFNRLELLYKYYPSIYNRYVWELGMYKPLADTYVEIRNDAKYMKYYEKRQLLIKEWYKNLHANLDKILSQIEKQTKSKFTANERRRIHANYTRKK